VKIVIAGGGTAGHVFPAVALADRLAEDLGAEISFVGSQSGQEATLVPEAGYKFDAVEAAPLLREVSIRAAKAPLVALRSVSKCGPLVAGADVVVGMGGYVSAPAVLAAARARIPVVLHEQNAVPGLANRLLARRAVSVGVSFEDARQRFATKVPVTLTGNPVRARILEVSTRRAELASQAWAALDLEPRRLTVVVLGGSQGALHVDQSVAAGLDEMRDRGDIQLIVLTGPAHLEVLAGSTDPAMALRVRAMPFLDRMELAYAVADLAVARAGATSIAELSVCGIPSILIPYPHATENHQEANAREVQRAGAAEILLDRNLSPGLLARRILALVDDDERRHAMAKSAIAWGKPDADERLASLVREAAA
jgi:UDP-N-acetylglucosamine--N-acetylmuramyl-(pentapeptide) pyrophosphoryl-undecaprenol N-acetylglucosamine transferase